MKKIFLLVFITIMGLSWNLVSQENTGFKINGSIEGYNDSVVFLKIREPGEWITIDSAKVTNGSFQLQGRMDVPELCYLLNSKNQYIMSVFLENSDILIKVKMDDLRNPEIIGSKSQDALNEFYQEIKPFKDKMIDLHKQYKEAKKAGNKELKKELDEKHYAIEDEKLAFTKKYIGDHNKSAVIPYILYRELSYSVDVNVLDSLFKLLDPSLASSSYYKYLDKRIKILYNVAVGKVAPDFTLNDTTGNPISVSQFRGKYLLIDFWAAWCRPCRAENPNNVKLYADYKDKGFEILGVSFDNKRDAWVKAIKKDGLIWPQVSDLKGWGSAAGKLYGVNSIPHTVLLDKNGVIIAKNLRGEKLREKISELLD